MLAEILRVRQDERMRTPQQQISNPLVQARLRRYFDEYAAVHRTPKNQWAHYIGIPMITISVPGLFAQIVFYNPSSVDALVRFDAGVLLVLLSSLFYLFLVWKIGIPTALFALGLYGIGRSASIPVLIAVFIVGWVIQFIGHIVYEKRSPAFFTNLYHLLIGPLWVFSKWVGYTE